MSLSRRDFVKSSLGTFALGASPGGLSWAEIDRLLLQQDPVEQRRRAYLELLRRVLRPTVSDYDGRMNRFDRTWEEWLERTGELPPDFASMRSSPRLPHPLLKETEAGFEAIETVADWEEHRGWIKEQFQTWVYGRFPPDPDNLRVRSATESREGDVTNRKVVLEFGPDRRCTLSLELLIPPGPGRFPCLLTNHQRRRPWVNTAIRRGYMGCIYYAIDERYNAGDDSDAWLDIYDPEYDFSIVGRWAWAASRAVDYLLTLPQVDPERIAIGGHSRNSKQALAAAAFDERIGAVVASRGNVGDQIPWRLNTEMFVAEPLEWITWYYPHFFHPRLRFFAGREDMLPVDQNQLLSLVAPRGLLMSHAYMEHQGNPIAEEQSYRSAREVYRLYDNEENLGLYQQPGEHAASVGDIEAYFDFFDGVFGRTETTTPRMFVHGYDFEEWRAKTGTRIDPAAFPLRQMGDFPEASGSASSFSERWPVRREEILDRLSWMMGDTPPGIPFPTREEARGSSSVNHGWRGQLIDTPRRDWDFMESRRVNFGDHLRGDLYYPSAAEENTRLPLVVWLHPYSYNMGYSRYAYWADLVALGFAVFAFDQIGFGVRNGDALRFYDRYPGWSLMGKMVTDTRAAIDALSRLDYIDADRISMAGYALGGSLSLVTAALDQRVKSVSVLSAFSPLRTVRESQGSEAIWHFSHLHGLAPRLGFFIGQEERLPVDFDEILAVVAPRPVQIVAPTLDRYHPIEEVRAAVDGVRPVFAAYGAVDALRLDMPEGFNTYWWGPEMNQWLANTAGLEPGGRVG